MKKSILYFLTAIMLFAVSCSESYDDSALVGRVDNLENRVAKLEELCKQMNTNISSLQTLVNALQNNDYVTGVTPITKNGETIGYTITFTKSQHITIYHGEDGKDGVNGTDGQDGHTPVIGVKQDTDGIYYWTLDGDWLLDDVGNKIKAQGTDGKDGVDGTDGKDGENGKDGINGTDGKDGITPQLKIENDYWYISYDNGVTWTQLGKATGEDGQNGVNGTNGTNGVDGIDGDSFFQGVDTSNDDYVIFTLADGTELVLPRHKTLSISFDIAEGAACMPSASIKVGYKLTGADSGTTIETIGDGGWKSVVTKTSISSGYITVTAPESGGDGKVVMLATTSNGFTAMKAITFEEGVIMDVSDAYQVNYENSTLEVTLRTNLAYTVSIPDDAKSWISVADTRASIRTETLTFTIKENPEENPVRYATIKLIGECGDMLQSFVIMQDYQPSSNPIVFADANVKKVCVEKYDTNGDGELSEKEAAAVTTTNANFFGEYASFVTSFNEFQYFTGIREIVNSTFEDCSKIESIILPNSITSIGVWAFGNCSKLKEIVIPNSVTRIGSSALMGTGIESISIPASVTEIESYTFYACTSLKSIDIPNSITRIGENAFDCCYSLVAIDIPNSVSYIGEDAFLECQNLESITLPNSIKTLERGLFYNCYKLSSVKIPDSVTLIHELAFVNCWALTQITLPDSLTAIGAAFSGCENLKSFYGKFSSNDNRCISTDGELIAFAPAGLISYTIPNSITKIGKRAFIECDKLEEIIIPDGVTKIGEWAFSECHNLDNVIIPGSVAFIDSSAFYNCDQLTTVYIKSTIPPVIRHNVFLDIEKIYVPATVVDTYKAADGWKDYADKIVGYDF